jgi:ribosomal protein S18 acetylase RimI-like enzyme
VGISSFERATAFEHRFAKAQATEVVDLSWGYALLQADFPLSQYHNRIAVTSAPSTQDVLDAAEEVLGGAGAGHRYVSVDNDVSGQSLVAGLKAAGYEHETIATMVYAGPDVESGAPEVRAVSLDTMRATIIRDWRVELPEASDEELGQLADRTELYARGAELTRLAVFEGDVIAAHADLYIDRVEGIAQFENLTTHEDFRGRGYGRALVREALWLGQQARCELSFLTAGLEEWPYEWYQRLKYVDVGRTHHFTQLVKDAATSNERP